MKPRRIKASFSHREKMRASLQPTPHPRDFVAPLVQLTVILPRPHLGAPRRPSGLIPQRPGQVPRLGACGRPVPEQRGILGGRGQALPPRAARRGGGGVPGRVRGDESRARLRRHPMHRGGPPPREHPRGEGRVYERPRPGGRDLDDGAGSRLGLPLEAPAQCSVPRRAAPVTDAGLRLAVHPCRWGPGLGGTP